jgi:hypothetical protein
MFDEDEFGTGGAFAVIVFACAIALLVFVALVA